MRPHTLGMMERWSLTALDHLSPKVLGRVMWNFARWVHTTVDHCLHVPPCELSCPRYTHILQHTIPTPHLHILTTCRVGYQPSQQWFALHNVACLRVIPHMNVQTLTCAVTAWRLLPQPVKPTPYVLLALTHMPSHMHV